MPYPFPCGSVIRECSWKKIQIEKKKKKLDFVQIGCMVTLIIQHHESASPSYGNSITRHQKGLWFCTKVILPKFEHLWNYAWIQAGLGISTHIVVYIRRPNVAIFFLTKMGSPLYLFKTLGCIYSEANTLIAFGWR